MNTRQGTKCLARRILGVMLSLLLVFSTIIGSIPFGSFGIADEVQAKARNKKNEQACEHCEAVRDNEPPAGYTEVIEGKVYSGGNSKTSNGTDKNKGIDGTVDYDPTDFAKPLPYGNVYVDASKLNWDNPNGFIIDIKDDRFQWVSISDEPLKDAKNNTSTNDPMGVEGAGPLIFKGGSKFRAICYVGPLQSYLANITDKATAPTEGVTTTNVITPDAGVPYLYRITYLNAVTLPNGTKGNLVLTMKKVQIETSVTINDEKDDNGKFKNSYKLSYKDAQEVTHEYEYTKAFMKIQGENQLSNDTGYQITDAHGNDLNQDYTEVLSAEDAGKLLAKINAELPDEDALSADTWGVAKSVRNATGNLLDLDIEVTDAEGNEVEGTISYAAHDMDFESAQTIWGRPLGDEFSEGMTIVSGSQSYALVPDYSKLVDGVKVFYKDAEDATTRATGWAPVGPGQDALDRVLDIKEQVSGQGHADGVRFASPFLLNFRGANGDFSDAIYSDTQVLTFQGDGPSANNNIIIDSDLAKNKMTNVAKQQVYARLKADDRPSAGWRKVTPKLAWDKLGNHYWKTYRNDDNVSFDSGFAVLLDSKKTSIQWSGSRVMNSNINTTLFDPTLFTYIEQTHGTGGGIYMENYNLSQGCAVTPMEGVVTMGRGSDATVTAVPEDGYRIKEFQIGGAELANPVTYTTVYGTDGKITGIKSGDTTTPLSGGKATVDGIEFELNNDGSVDISFTDIQDPRHIHVDFDADYYFYKVWKGGDPTKLNMTAVPYAYIFTDVTLPVPTGEYDDDDKPIYDDGTHFSIDGTEYTADDGTKYVLNPNNNLETVEKDQATGDPVQTLPYVLKGNSFVLGDKEYPVTVKFGVNFASAPTEGKVQFVINGPSDYVTELGKENDISPGNIVWKIKYPASGVESLGWLALPIETEPVEHNRNHVERNYWFVTEEVAGWSLEGYDNSNAEIPGVVSDDYYKDHIWRAASVKDYDAASDVIHNDFLNKNAYMSVFSLDADNTKTAKSYGGEIANIPSVVVKGVKNWEDQNNLYNNRAEIWLHIDATVGNVVTKDILPPQMLEVGTDASQTVTWGDKKVYETNQDNIEIIHDLADIPLKDGSGRRITYVDNGDGSYTATNGITYWLNELVKITSDGTVIQYTIRETMDAAGGKPVEKDPDAGLVGYTAEKDEVPWDDMDKTLTTKVDGVDVDTYQGELTNTFKLIDIKATKVWDDNDNQDGYRKDVTFVLDSDGALDELPGGQKAEVTIIADDDSTWEVEWTGLPKYKDGKRVQYNVLEEGRDETLYFLDFVGEEDEEGNQNNTFTNIHIPETATISIFKEWDDKDNQDDLRKEAAKVSLEGKTESEKQYQTATDQEGNGLVKGVVPVEDGLVITWMNVPVKRNGEDITYKLSEDISGLGGYYTDPKYVDEEFTLKNGENKEATVINHETPEVTEVTITKEWDDMDNHDGIRPDSVTVQFIKTYQKIKETKEEVTKQVTVDGEKYDVKENADEGEYFEIDGKYYRGDDIEIVNNKVTDYEELVPFNPDDTGEPVENGKTVTIDDIDYFVKVTEEGQEYYAITEEGDEGDVTKYYDPETGDDLKDKEGFHPSEDDEFVTEPLVIVIDDTEYEVKLGNLAGEEVWYIEKDGKFYSPFTDEPFSEELIKFIPSEEDEVVTIEVAGEPEYEEAVETRDIVLSEANKWTETITDLNVNEPVGQKVIYSVEEKDVPEGYEATVKSTDPGKFTVTNKHEVTIKPPVGEPEVTEDYKGKPQTSPKIKFTPDPDTLGPGGTENKIERVTLVDEDGNEVNEVTVPGEGKYVLNDDGTITFTPEPDFVGKTKGVKVRGYDSNGLSADTTYTPTVKHKVKYIDPLNPEGKQTVEGPRDCNTPDASDDTTTYEDTPGSESKNHPGYRFDGWDEVEIDDPDHPGDKITVRTAKYTPMYNINYDPNGGSGDMADDDYAADDPAKPHKKNTFTRDGYKFIGFKAYITDPTTGKETPILDKDGNPIIFQDMNEMKEYFEGMPGGTSIRMEAQWKKLPVVTYTDPATGRTFQKQVPFLDDTTEPPASEDPTREGYTFTGWKRTEIYDDDGELVEVLYEATWKENPKPTPAPETTPEKKPSKAVKTGDESNPLIWAGLIGLAALSAGALVVARRKKTNK